MIICYWSKNMAQIHLSITFQVFLSPNVCLPLSACTYTHKHRFADWSRTENWKETLFYAQSAGDLCCVSCRGWPSAHVPAPWMKPFTGAGLWTPLLSDWLPRPLLQMIFQQFGAKDEICPNRNSLICQLRNDTRTRSWWKVTAHFCGGGAWPPPVGRTMQLRPSQTEDQFWPKL